MTSPGGLVRALLPTVQETKGSWVGWTGERDGQTEVVHADGIDLYPVPIHQGRRLADVWLSDQPEAP